MAYDFFTSLVDLRGDMIQALRRFLKASNKVIIFQENLPYYVDFTYKTNSHGETEPDTATIRHITMVALSADGEIEVTNDLNEKISLIDMGIDDLEDLVARIL